MSGRITPTLTIYQPPAVGPSIVYADDTVLVIDKPAGLLSVPGKGAHLADCAETRVQAVYPSARIVHRLDRETSGLMVMGLTKQAHRHLSIQFENRKVFKAYQAVLWGKLCDQKGEVDLPLICDWPNRPLQKVDFEIGKPSQTRWEVQAYASLPLNGKHFPVTSVRFCPQTGRSHQLRVHAKSLGHPILGDSFYAHEKALKLADRLQLHAETLVFRHPVDKRLCGFNSFAKYTDSFLPSDSLFC